MADIPGQARAAIERLLGGPIAGIQRVGGGRNSRVCGVDTEDGRLAAKICADPGRVIKEYEAISFLVDSGIECVPRPLGLDREAGCALYTFVEGTKVLAGDVGEVDIDRMLGFLRRLRRLSTAPGSREIAPASEACFSISDVILSVRRRVDRLSCIDGAGPEYDALRDFLDGEMRPGVERVADSVSTAAETRGVRPDHPLPRAHRILSPSDFGFHNVLRRPDGSFVFLDFEHFGWDDPAKTISDFLLHPHEAMAIREDLKKRFATSVRADLPEDKGLGDRTEIAFPLFGLKWCTILLNEFVPSDRRRRALAENAATDRVATQRQQLAKARRTLDFVMKTYDHFPYWN